MRKTQAEKKKMITKYHWPFYLRIDRDDDISTLKVEDLYQAFKERLMAELVAEWSADKTHFPLTERADK